VKHVPESGLALYAAGDLPLWQRAFTAAHVTRCETCAGRVSAYRNDRAKHRETADQMPDGLDWESLSAEMAANIRVGLAAGECVADPHAVLGGRSREGIRAFVRGWDWRPAAAIAGVLVLLMGAWWLNMPSADNLSLTKAMRAIARGGRDRMPQFVRGMDDRAPMVEVSASGISVRENGGALGVSQDGARPVTISVSVQGSASARYVDNDTGQVTVTSVYVQ